MRTALLRGSEHATLAATDTIAEGRAAIAISRGGAPKTYAHTHPNEDAAGFAEGSRGVLVAVADGHWGCEASEAALASLLEGRAGPWTDGEARAREEWEAELYKGVVAAHEAAVRAQPTAEGRVPRTTLALALVRPEDDLLLVTSVGDSHLFGVDTDSVSELGRPDAPVAYLGARSKDGTPLPPDVHVIAQRLSGTRIVVAATDGLSEFGIGLDDPEGAVAAAVQRAVKGPRELRARDTARHLLEAALAAQRENGAGDNVAAAVAWLKP